MPLRCSPIRASAAIATVAAGRCGQGWRRQATECRGPAGRRPGASGVWPARPRRRPPQSGTGSRGCPGGGGGRGAWGSALRRRRWPRRSVRRRCGRLAAGGRWSSRAGSALGPRAGEAFGAPDLPGYNTSDKPPRVRDYRPSVLTQEVADLIVALGAGSATVAGHDWGGGLAWLLAMQHPERVQRLVVLNAPHPIRFLKGLRSPRQLRRSWYMLAFQLPWLPERLLAARDFQGHCCIRAVASWRRDCRYENPPSSPCSRYAVRLCRLPLPT